MARVAGHDVLLAIRLFVALVAAAALVGLVVRRLAMPYTVALVLLGLGVSLVAPLLPVPESIVITPELVLSVLLPGLVFEAVYTLDVRELRRAFGGIALLAAPGVILTAVVVSLVLSVGTGLAPALGFVVGAMVAATDPAAVVATFGRLGVPSRLETLVEGESLFNDGTGLVVFAIAVRAVQADVTPVDALVAFTATVAVSAVIGAAAGWLASRIIATVDDHLIELTISVALAYGTYVLADALHKSGVIATVVAGVVLGSYGRRTAMSARTRDALALVWEFLAFLLTALVFLLVGLAIAIPSLIEALPAIAWAVLAIVIARVLVVYVLLGGGSRLRAAVRHREPIPTPWLHVLFWAGLRGAVAVAMALSLPIDFPSRSLLQEITFGVVLFTLLVQGLSVDVVVRRVLGPKASRRAEGVSPAG